MSAQIGPRRPKLGRFRAESAEVVPHWDTLGREAAEFGMCRPRVGQSRPGCGQIRAILAEANTSWAQNCLLSENLNDPLSATHLRNIVYRLVPGCFE